MKYKILVSKENNPHTFHSLEKIINHVRNTYLTSSTVQIKDIINKEYNIKFGEYDPETQNYPIEFKSEQDFLMFKIRWS
jgi:hypothetical protein